MGENWLLRAGALALIWPAALVFGQPFATGPRQHAPPADRNVDVRLIMEDPQDYVWVSGPKGTFRYDGLQYVPASAFGLPPGEATQMDSAGGAVWVLIEQDLWRFDGERFQRISGAFDGMVGAGEYLYVDLSGERRVAVLGRRGSEWTVISVSTVHPRHHQLQAGSDGRIWYGAFSSLAWTKWNGREWEYGSLGTTPKIDELWQVVPAGKSDFLTTNGYAVMRFRQTGPASAAKVASEASESRHPREHVFASSFGVWVLVKGCMLRPLTDEGGGFDYFRYAGPHKIFSLRAGKRVLWAAAGTAGLLAFSHSRSIQWIQPDNGAQGLAKSAVHSGGRLLFGRADVTYEVIADGANWDFGLGTSGSIATAKPFGLPASQGPYEDTAFAPDGSIWHIQPKEGAVHVSPAGQWIATAGGFPGPQGKAHMRKLAFSNDGRVWVASRQNLWRVILRPPPDYVYEQAGSWQGPRYVADFARDPEGNLFAVSDGALLRYAAGKWAPQDYPPCLLSPQTSTGTIAGTDSLWFAYRDRPGFTHAVRTTPSRDWECTHFLDANGFPGVTSFLRIDRRGRLWRGTDGSVQFARLADGAASLRWQKVGVADGLYDGEPTSVFREEPDGSLLIGVGPTLQRLPPDLIEGVYGEIPKVEGLQQKGTLRPVTNSLEVKRGAEGSIAVSAMAADPSGRMPGLEYSLGETWIPLSGASIPLNEIPTGDYKLQIRFSGASRAAVLPLRVLGVWYQSRYLRLFLLTLAGLCTWRVRPLLSKIAYQFGKWRYLRSGAFDTRSVTKPLLDWPKGTVLRDRYRVEGLLAVGGFSDVFAAVDTDSGSSVVIKRLRLPASAVNVSRSWLKTRFLREVGVAGLLRGPGILPILDTWFDDQGTPHIVMPRVVGVTLRQYLDRKAPLPRGEVIHLLSCLAETLHFAHERGVVHCDVKPENILIPQPDEHGLVRPIIIDFGTAALHLQTDTLSDTTIGAGSIRYMAPEQMLGRYSPASDVYAFASLSLELIAHTRYASLNIAIDRDWERNFQDALTGLGIQGCTAALLIQALCWDPTQRCNDILRWTRDLVESLAGPDG